MRVGPLSDQVQGQPRSAALTAGLDGLASSPGGRVSFTTLRNVYTDAMTNFRNGPAEFDPDHHLRPAHRPVLDGAGLQEIIRGAFDPARPVAVNVIDFGDDPDRATWQAVARSPAANTRA